MTLLLLDFMAMSSLYDIRLPPTLQSTLQGTSCFSRLQRSRAGWRLYCTALQAILPDLSAKIGFASWTAFHARSES